MNPMHYLPVNWVDGMKITKDHFITIENVLNERIQDVIASTLNEYNYGLLPPINGEINSLHVDLLTDNQDRVKVKIKTCRAITRSGARIEISDNSLYAKEYSILLPEGELSYDGLFDLVISIEPYKRMPVGECDESEEPPRYPFTLPRISVNVIKENELANTELGPNFLTIGKVKLANTGAELVANYIPACCSVQSLSKLRDLHHAYDRFLSQMEIDSVNIIKKTKEKDQSYELAQTIKVLAESVLHFLSSNLINFRKITNSQAPIEMFEKIGSLARVMKNTIDSNMGAAKEELLNYLSEWCQLNQGELENVLEQLVDFQYKHSQIHEMIKRIDDFTVVSGALFSKLSALEYIGKRKETGIFVKEQPGKKSFLAD